MLCYATYNNLLKLCVLSNVHKTINIKNKYLYSALSCITQSAVSQKQMIYYLEGKINAGILREKTAHCENNHLKKMIVMRRCNHLRVNPFRTGIFF